MMTVRIQIGAKVRRKNDTGMDTPGVVARLSDAEAMIYWPQDNYYEIIPASNLEPYGLIQAAT